MVMASTFTYNSKRWCKEKDHNVCYLYVLLQLLLILPKCCHSTPLCAARDYGWGSVVCVCNSTHCDDGPKADPAPCGYLAVYTTSKAGLRFHGETKPLHSHLHSHKCTTTLGQTVGASLSHQCYLVGESKKQTILGFGGSFTDATGININRLSPGSKDQLMKSYFSKDGIQYTLCRVPIGGTDFSTRFYTYQDDENGPFGLAPEDVEHKIPLIHMARQLSEGSIRLFASPWGAPKWMRVDDGLGPLKHDVYQLWADYFVRFFEEYEKNNVTFWGATIQNEPFFAPYLKSILPTIANFLAYDVDQLTRFLTKYLGPTLKSSAFSQLKLMTFDENLTLLPFFRQKLLEPSYIDGLAFHWYMNQYINYSSLLTDTHWMYPDKFLLSTEACTGVLDMPDVKLGDWERGEEYGFDIIKVLQNWGSGWVDWNMALDTDGAPNWINNFVDSPIIVNATEDSFYKQPMFYVLGHFSKFIPPGSSVVDVTCHCPDGHLEMVAASVTSKDQINRKVLVVLNRSEASKAVEVKDSELDVIIEMNVPPKAIQTYVWRSCVT